MKTTITRLFKSPFHFFAVCSLLAIIGVVLQVSRSAIAAQMDDWQLLPRPERLTELYFSDYHALPASAKQGTTQQLAFTVHNLEYRATTYHYKILAAAESKGIEQLMDSGDLTLNHDETKELTHTITFPALTPALKVKVELTYQGIPFGSSTLLPQKQSIHYWVTIQGKNIHADT